MGRQISIPGILICVAFVLFCLFICMYVSNLWLLTERKTDEETHCQREKDMKACDAETVLSTGRFSESVQKPSSPYFERHWDGWDSPWRPGRSGSEISLKMHLLPRWRSCRSFWEDKPLQHMLILCFTSSFILTLPSSRSRVILGSSMSFVAVEERVVPYLPFYNRMKGF